MSLLRAFATVSSLTLISRVAGFARDVLTAIILGAGPIADAFVVALKLPNLFRRITAEGAFSVSFVPMFSRRMETDGARAAHALAGQTLSMMLVLLIPFTLLAMLVMPGVVSVIAPGFVDEPERFSMAVEMARITFPYLVMMSLVALFGGVLNAMSRFAAFAAAPILFNLCLITALLTLPGLVATPGHALSWGVAAAGIAQLVLMLVAVRRAGVSIPLPRPALSDDMKRLGRLMGPGILGAGVVQINLFVDMVLASFLQAGAVSWLYYADRLNQMPLGVLGIAIGTALLPMLSRLLAASDAAGARDIFSRALELCLFLGLPAALALAVVPELLIAALFERGAFTAADTAATSAALMAYAIGIPAFVIVKVQNTVFFAAQDTLSPVKVSIIITVLNIALSLALIGPLGHQGIALATGITAWAHTGILWFMLRNTPEARPDARFFARLPGIILASIAMAAGLWLAGPIIAPLIDAGFVQSVGVILGFVGAGLMLYIGLAFVMRGFTPAELRRALRKA